MFKSRGMSEQPRSASSVCMLMAALLMPIRAEMQAHAGFPIHQSRAAVALHLKAGLRMLDVDGSEIRVIDELDEHELLWATDLRTKCARMRELLQPQAVLRPGELHTGGHQMQAMLASGNCAVVGASGARVSRSDFGTDIDRHHTVVRINNNPSGSYPEPSSKLRSMVGTKTDIRVHSSLNLLAGLSTEEVAQIRFIYPWFASQTVGALGSDGTKLVSTLREATACRGAGEPSCSHMTDSFVATAASLVTTALQPLNSSKLNREVIYASGGLISGLKPSVGFLGVVLAVALCQSAPVDMYYYKLCSQQQASAAPICTHPDSVFPTPSWYCKITLDERIAHNDGGPGRLNSQYKGPDRLFTNYSSNYSSSEITDGCLKFDHDFAQEHATYQLMEACGLVKLHT